MAADIVGYSRLMEADEPGTLGAIRKLRSVVIDPLVSEHGGRIVKLMGDGVIVEFTSVVDAVACAVAIQQGLRAQQAAEPAVSCIVLRIGINLGDVVAEDGDLLGDGVNVAARVEQLCPPGGVLVSGTAYDQLHGKLFLPLDFAGEQHVKNIARPLRLYRVRLDGGKWPPTKRPRVSLPRFAPTVATMAVVLVSAVAGGWWLMRGEDVRARPSIAVLPFKNLGRDEATDRLADGITEEIITDLARFREFEVIARNSVAAYKGGETVDIIRIGQTLRVRYVLEGSIQRQADRFRVTAQLSDADNGTNVWSDRWDRPAADVFEVQEELSQQLTAKLSGIAGTIITVDRETARRKPPSDLGAYDLFVLASEAKLKETRESIAECISLLERSLAIDPSFARAWTLLGSCHAVSFRWTANWGETNQLYQEATRRAVELDPLDADAHASLAFARAFGGDLAEAEVEFDKAIALNPNSADVLTRYAFWSSSFGKPDHGAEMALLAIRLDPNAPPWALRFQSSALLQGGHYEDAVRIRQRIPRAMFADGDYVELATALVALDKIEEAKTVAGEGMSAFPAITIESWTGDPGWTDAERNKTIDLMRKAGFPSCASATEVKKGGVKVRLPECQ